MLTELAVRDLGIVNDLRLELDAGLTAVSGETGAGKTLIVEAIGLLTGMRADGTMVRSGAEEATVEGRFELDGEEIVLRRVVPAAGRSRAYVNGDMATAATLAQRAAQLVDLHAQHAHQSLLTATGQRRALDRFAEVDTSRLQDLRQQVRSLLAELESTGGDAATRQREAELVRFQLEELDAAQLGDPDEDELLAVEQDALSDVVQHREQANVALAALSEEGGVGDRLAVARGALDGRAPFTEVHDRLVGLAAEITDLTTELRGRAEQVVDDPERLTEVLERRQLLATLSRKYGDGTIDGLHRAQEALQTRLDQIEGHDARAAELSRSLESRRDALGAEEARVAAVRRSAAPELADRVQQELRRLALPHARLVVAVGDADPGDEVEISFSANPGTPLLPLSKVASGGELARTMLALRLVLTADQDTLVFDEVDAGIGGSAASAVGRALSELGSSRQVLVVTHLAQVAAAAATQIGVTKVQHRRSTTTEARLLVGDERVVELSRMLSGQPTSDAAHAHARDLLSAVRGSDGGA